MRTKFDATCSFASRRPVLIAPMGCRSPKLRPNPDLVQAATRRLPWAELLRRVYDIDALFCPKCGAGLRMISPIMEPGQGRTFLRSIGLPREPPVVARARSPVVRQCFGSACRFRGASRRHEQGASKQSKVNHREIRRTTWRCNRAQPFGASSYTAAQLATTAIRLPRKMRVRTFEIKPLKEAEHFGAHRLANATAQGCVAALLASSCV